MKSKYGWKALLVNVHKDWNIFTLAAHFQYLDNTVSDKAEIGVRLYMIDQN